MKDIVEHLPEIIKAASSSILGIVALMLILFSALSWGFFQRSSDKWKLTSLILFMTGAVIFGYTAFETSKNPSFSVSASLKQSLLTWVSEAEKARKAKTISSHSALPTNLINARNDLEKNWRSASLSDKKAIDSKLIFNGLSYLNRLYRVVENDSSVKVNATFWVNESIRFFEEIQNAYYLTEALIDKAALYLDISQLGHNDKHQFEQVAKEGDAVINQAYQISNPQQQSVILRISSRFYYNLARPASFRLSDQWDNNYLLLAYDKALKAYEIEPEESKNANQLARVTIKVSKNPPQNTDPIWTLKLRDAKEKLKQAWIDSKSSRTGLIERLSPLNVLGVITTETLCREWQALDKNEKSLKTAQFQNELELDALSPLREAVALLNNSQLRKAYGFDIYYDIARAYSLKTDLVRQTQGLQATSVFSEVKINLKQAKENAKTSQLESAVKDIDQEITFSFLKTSEIDELKQVLSIGL